jgi:hypothetical protein
LTKTAFGPLRLDDAEAVLNLVQEYDINQNGYLEWEEFVNLFDDMMARSTSLEVRVMRLKTAGEEEDSVVGTVHLDVSEVQSINVSCHVSCLLYISLLW